ncbi:MAG TPA: nitroreductase family protein [Iamia sp.]|jgi:nitroreductase|nr:nitroreductase family protein [Iamia sp.]
MTRTSSEGSAGGAATPVIEAVLARRSTREGFAPDPPTRAQLEAIIRCGDAAPSSKSARPWRFHVVTGRALLDAVADDVDRAPDAPSYVPHDPATGRPVPRWSSTVAESAAVLRAAPAAIFVESRGVFGGGRRALLAAPPEGLASALVGYGLELVGIGAAVQNVLLAAWSLGVPGVFMGDVLIAEPAIRSRLHIAGDLVGAVALGPTAHPPPPRDPRPPDDVVVWH